MIATSTKPYRLDAALRRAGRFDREIAIRPPTQEQRLAILEKYFEEFGVKERVQEFLVELSLLTRGFSGADCELFVRQVMLRAVASLNDDDDDDGNTAAETRAEQIQNEKESNSSNTHFIR